MKIIITLISLIVSFNLLASPLSVERLFSSPDLDGSPPTNLRFSPNGERLSFLKAKTDNYEVLDLWEYDLKSGEPRLLVDSNSLRFGELSEAEKARRERMRIQSKGITEYFWSNDAKEIVFPAGGNLYLYDLVGKKLAPLTTKHAGELDVKFSPHDHFISFVRSQDLFVLDAQTKKEYRLTRDGKGDISNGLAEFIAQEEMDRFTGYWWSDDEKYIAYVRVDDGQVKTVERYDIQADSVVVHKQKYPEAGTANSLVKLGVVPLADAHKNNPSVRWVDLGSNKDIYLADARWTPMGKLFYQIQTRDQKSLTAYLYDPKSGKSEKFLTEQDVHWVNLSSNWRWLKKTSQLIWSSERSGFRHFYLYDSSGKLVRAVTSGDWPIDNLVGVDEENSWVYFTSGKKSPLEKHLYRVSYLKPSEPEVLTIDEGQHEISMNESAQFYVRRFSEPTTPPQTFLHKANGELISTLAKNEVKADHPLFDFQNALVKPEFGSFKGPSGDTLYYRIYKPKDFSPRKKYPMLVFGYGGPHSQVVAKNWGGKWELFSDILAGKGYIVASFDNRGSARRGKKFEDYLYRAIGTVEVEDQTAGVAHLVSLGFVDPKRVGFLGWSYGGYVSTALILKQPNVYRANIAVAPVIDFSLYDTHYTERYLGKPKEEVEAYKRANNLNFIDALTGRLLIMHGMADDNVLLTNSTMLFKELQKKGKVYESLTYPGAKHGISGRENQTHVFKSIEDFLLRNL